ncbi:MAG: GNAT family N-acetyltransferase [Prevotella sp.]|nr:GNAT family N-acetyltransferase [Prevotella sp.]MBO6234465.1 GNAT family N-acetyltransferase [Prevotella sp.]MBP3750961.1 GNAT family N-acetyltransferase [Prevotella sp.]
MTLRALEPQDLELLYTIENDREQWQVADTNAPYSRYDLENYILSQQHDVYADKQLRLVVCDDKGSGVGLVDLFNFSPANKRAELGLAILKSERGKGYANKALQLMSEYAKNTLHLHQIYCIVPEDNEVSLDMLHTASFIDDTLLKEWLATPEGYKNCYLLFKYL